MKTNNEWKSKHDFKLECEEYLRKKLDGCSDFEKKLMEELEARYGYCVTVKTAMEIIGRSRSTIYKYKDDNSFIYKQNERKILIYTKSLIFVL